MSQQPNEQQRAGRVRWKRQPTPYERFMEEEGIPVVRGIGLNNVRELPLSPWARLGGRGSYIQLDGTEGVWGMYVVEIPPRSELRPERHVYEEVYFVVEGRGSTEVWKESASRRQVFEWQAGSLFSVPVNCWHRLVNAGSSPVLVLAATGAPALMNIVNSTRFIFDNPFDFTDRYDDSLGYFSPKTELEPHPLSERAILRSNMIPDIVNCELPVDNHRSPGYRWFEPFMAGNHFFGGGGQQLPFIAEHQTGRYSKAHAHASGAVLVCLKGKGYTCTWPTELGTRPWEAGKGHLVKRQDYVPGGMVTAAPGGGNWFHQHFGVGKEAFRVLAIAGGYWWVKGKPGDDIVSNNADLEEGGRSIPYAEEDPWVRAEFKRALAEAGTEFRMPE